MVNPNRFRAGKSVSVSREGRSKRAGTGQVNSRLMGIDLNPPTSISAIASETSVSLSFTAPSGDTPTNFAYALSTNGGSTYGAYTAVSPADAVSPITISSLTSNEAYVVRLKSIMDGEESGESAPVSFQTLAAAPTSLSASGATSSAITVSFTQATGGGETITNYKYALSTNGGSSYGAYTALSPADATSPITITGLTSNQAYFVKIRAVTAAGDGTESSGLSFQTLAVAPTSLAVSAIQSGLVSLTFTQTTGGGATISNYKYALSTNGGASYGAYTALSPADATSPISISGLTSNQAYFVKLRAVTTAGDGDESSGLSFQTLAAAPTGLSASNVIETSADISFTQATGGGATISNYKYALSTNGGSTYGSYTALSPTDSTSPITVSGLTAGVAYFVKIRAVTTAGDGDESTATSFTTLNPPTSVEYLVVAGGGAGSGGWFVGSRTGGGGAGGMRTASGFAVSRGTGYTVTVGAGGVTANGNNSQFGSISCTGGGSGARVTYGNGFAGGSGGGSSGFGTGGAGTAGEGNNGGTSSPGDGGSGGGGKGSAGTGQTGVAGAGQASSITGSSVTYATGGTGDSGGCAASAPNTGNGGNGRGDTECSGQSGIVVIRYANTFDNLTSIAAGLTYTLNNTGGFKIYTFTAGTGTVTV